jgi:cardiolipin synthase
MNAWFPRITVHSLAIVVSVLTYVLTTRAVRERRPPSIAIAWVLGMIALPYLVLPMYVMFGRRKMPRKQARRGLHCVGGRHWAEDLIESFDLPAATNDAVRMHLDGKESAGALFEIMSGAKSRLDICTYILGNDEFGRAAMQRMAECAARGVRVRLLLDGVGALQLPRWCFTKLESAGIQTAIFSPLFARKTQGPRNLRNHRKLVIADSSRLWAGGRNIAAEYFTGLNGIAPWADLSFDLEGAVAHAAGGQFELDWVAAGGKPASGDPLEMAAADIASGIVQAADGAGPPSAEAAAQTAPPPALARSAHSSARAQFLPSGPDQTEDTVHALLIDACFHARERMLAVTPYFVPDNSLETAMRLAARRGVKIDLCIPAESNHRLADFARSRALRALSRAGVCVHLLPAMNHAKAVVFDTSLAISGSVNLDSRSLLLNYESAVVFYGATEIGWLADWIAGLIPQATDFDARQPSILRDVAEGLLLTVGYQL